MKLPHTKSMIAELTIFAISISTFTLVLTSISFLTIELHLSQDNLSKKLSTMGEVIAEQSTTAIAATNKASLNSKLASLKADINIIKGCIYDVNNILITSYPPPESPIYIKQVITDENPIEAQATCPQMMATLMANNSDHVEQYFPIKLDDKLLGTLYIASSDEALINHLTQIVIYSIVVLILSIILALMLAVQLQKTIIRPVNAFINTVQNIIQKNDLSIRAVKEKNDEFGNLTDSFNQLLNKVETNYSLSKKIGRAHV